MLTVTSKHTNSNSTGSISTTPALLLGISAITAAATSTITSNTSTAAITTTSTTDCAAIAILTTNIARTPIQTTASKMTNTTPRTTNNCSVRCCF